MTLRGIFEFHWIDKNEQIFISLNGGEIKKLFSTIENYIEYLSYGKIDYKLIIDIISTPNIIEKNGLNVYIFNRKLNESRNY